MKPEILKLAKECGGDDCIPNEPDRDGNFYMHYIELERFYHLAFNAGLEAAAKHVESDTHNYALCIRTLEMR